MFGIDDILGGVVSGIGGGLLGSSMSSADREKAIEANKKAVQEWLDIHVPDVAQQRLELQRYIQTGKMSPELESQVKQGKSAFEDVQADPALKSKQLAALDSMENIGLDGGLNFEDQADLQRQRSEIATRERGNREALLDRSERRGMGGSGAELASSLAAQQGSADRDSQASMDAFANSKKRALAALQGAGDMAGSMRNQDYQLNSDQARAKDVISNFNARNMQSVQSRNMDRANEAAKYNLDLQQGIANKNVDLGNKEQEHNKGLYQQQFEDQTRRAGGLTDAYGKEATAYGGQADRTARTWAGAGEGLASGFAADRAAQQSSDKQAHDDGQRELDRQALFDSASEKKKQAGGDDPWAQYWS